MSYVDEVDRMLQGIMVGIFRNLDNTAKEYGMDGNIAGFLKVVDAMLAQSAV